MSFQNLFISHDCKSGTKSHTKNITEVEILCQVLLQRSSTVLNNEAWNAFDIRENKVYLYVISNASATDVFVIASSSQW